MDTKSTNSEQKMLTNHDYNLRLLGCSFVVGLASGLVNSLYRLVLIYMEDFSYASYGFMAQHVIFILPAFILLGAMGYGIGILIGKYKMIGGSGIPQVKGILSGYLKDTWLATLAAKFAAGSVAMLAGLSLGREGPSIQLGACAAQGIGNKLVKTDHERRILIASGASAGLSAAFNAPLSGVIFTLEEIFKYFSPQILLTAMVASVVANFVSRMIFGTGSIFHFNVIEPLPLSQYWLLIILGLVLGLCGATYNKTLLLSLRLFGKIKNQKMRVIVSFLAAGAFGLLFPLVICGGHYMINNLNITQGIGFLCLAFLLKFIFSMLSYGSGAPGGIFFPLLVLGGTIGAIFAQFSIAFLGLDTIFFANMIILSMTGFFTAIVRSPITGILLLVEMTGSFSYLMPLSVVALTSFVTADLLKSEPIYDSLLRNLLAAQKGAVPAPREEDRKITVETIVHLGSLAEKKCVGELPLGSSCPLVSIRRLNEEFTPGEDTQIMAGDQIIFLVDAAEETELREIIDRVMKCK